MELVPIIQRVLTIVVALATVTLAFSYITFKIRQKKKPEQVYEKNQMEHMEPSFIGKSIRRITRITKEIIPLAPPIQPSTVKKTLKQNETRTPQRSPKSAHEKKKYDASKDLQKPRRIEVMNNFTDEAKEPIKKFTPKKKIDNAANSLGDDILDKYSDSEDHSLFTLKTNKKND